MNSYIETLTLNNYRGYRNNIFSFFPNINVVYGKNGIGKTNILESISFLSPGKGFLNSNLNDILRIAENRTLLNCNWSIFANIKNSDIVDTISVFSDNDNGNLKKKIKINGNIAKSQEELNKIFSIIWLTPEMQNFFYDDKSVRRKFLDRTVYILDNQHASRVAKYEFLLRERMKILCDSTKYDKNWLLVLEEKIAETGISIAVARNETVRNLNNILFNYDFNFPKFTIIIDGTFENMMLDNITSIQAEKNFREILFNNREQDKLSKRTNDGVHKSDLRLFYQNKNIDGQFCSTGEQKLLLISFTILKALMCKKLKKASPIILLDEVFSYLDKDNKIKLFNELLKLDIQSFMTGTDISIFKDICSSKTNFIDLEKLLKDN